VNQQAKMRSKKLLESWLSNTTLTNDEIKRPSKRSMKHTNSSLTNLKKLNTTTSEKADLAEVVVDSDDLVVQMDLISVDESISEISWEVFSEDDLDEGENVEL
jgi:hypothetical protein